MAMFFESESSSNSSSGFRCSYDVFLSFRGEDTRKNFIGHLYNALVQAGIHTYRDDIDLPRGEEISQQLFKAIEESMIFIVVFSKGYASSSWCLDELAKIMECESTIRQIVLPVFYDIDPSNIRKQTGSFAEAFKVHEERFKEEMEKVNKWRRALTKASNLSGYSLKDMANGYESTFIQEIVEDVSKKMNRKYLHVAKYPVGIESRVDATLACLTTGTNDVRIVGIHGMPGIGKTTVAKAVFNQLCNRFEGSCFIQNVAEESKQHNGLVRLQEQLLCEILKRDSWKINNVDRGINLINERLCCKRILVVLDDVEHQKQLDALMGNGSSFGLGSIIIVTTRNEHLLNRFEVLKADLLNEVESLQLFSRHAFGDTCPPKDYVELSNKVVDYCGGLPMALELLGSSLFKGDKIIWESAIDKLRKIPHHDIQKKLIISYEMLGEDQLKNTFLDIACFFIGRRKGFVAKVIEGRCGFNPEVYFRTLINRSLITVDHRGEINMHDLLRDMGREIVRQESPATPYSPEKRSRIWDHEDARNVLINQVGTEYVQGLAVDMRASEVEPLSTKSFTAMIHLQLLKIDGVRLNGRFNDLSKGLIWLCWHGCPLESLPSDFELGKLVVLDMRYSNIKELWKETKVLNKLKILNLSYCKYLAKMPNFKRLPNLERLILKNCTRLVEVPQSIGHLKSLKTLNVCGCSRLEKFPESMGDMESLTELLADGVENEQFLSSIVDLKNLKKLSFRGYSFNRDSPSFTSWVSLISSWLSLRGLNWKALLPSSLAHWSLLKKLKLGYSGVSEGATKCVDFGSLSSLEELDLSFNKFLNLPSGIGRLPKLETLWVDYCEDLLLISELPSSLAVLFAMGCTSMERVRLPIQLKYLDLDIDLCPNLMEIEGVVGLDHDHLGIECNRSCDGLSKNALSRFIAEGMSNIYCDCDVCFLNDEIPDWFSYREGEQSSLSFHLPPFFHGLVFWIGFEPATSPGDICVIIKNKSNDIQLFPNPGTYYISCFIGDRHSWVGYVGRKNLAMKEYCGEELELYLEISPEVRSTLKIIEIGVHVIVEKPDSVEESESEWEWDRDIDNLQGTTSSADVEEGDGIDS